MYNTENTRNIEIGKTNLKTNVLAEFTSSINYIRVFFIIQNVIITNKKLQHIITKIIVSLMLYGFTLGHKHLIRGWNDLIKDSCVVTSVVGNFVNP